jgi:Subtilisin-like serine proteases
MTSLAWATEGVMRYPANHGAESNGITTASEARKAGVISLIIKRREGTASVADKVGALVSREWDNHEVIQVPAGQADAIRALLAITDGVASVEEDSVVTPPEPQPVTAMEEDLDTQTLYVSSSDSGPNDPEYDNQFWWRKASTYGGASGVEDAWVLSEQHERLSIVVIDGGFDNHEDFSWKGGISLVGDGRGYLSYDESSCSSYHGQSVVSIIGATQNNGIGMAGMVEADFYAARALACDNSGYMSDVARAIRWAAGEDIGEGTPLSEPADIVNLSLGADTICTQSLQSAINKANDQGVMVVASAGNNSEDAQDYSPAGCNHVVTVGAVTLRGDQTTFSNHGDTLDVSAFGQQVRVQGPDGHRWMSGTSFSAPITSGILGLIRQDIPQLDPDTLRSLVLPATTPFGQTTEPMGAGVPNGPDFQEEVASLLDNEAASLHHAMAARNARQGAFFEHLGESRLCKFYEFTANEQGREEAEKFTIFEVAAGEAMTVGNGDAIKASGQRRFLLRNLQPADYRYGLQLCEDDSSCRSNELLQMDTRELAAPDRCAS